MKFEPMRRADTALIGAVVQTGVSHLNLVGYHQKFMGTWTKLTTGHENATRSMVYKRLLVIFGEFSLGKKRLFCSKVPYLNDVRSEGGGGPKSRRSKGGCVNLVL